jgi:hypothetical protein
LPCGKKGLKAKRVKVVGKIKSQDETFEMLHPRITEKAIEGFSVRKGEP